VGESGAGGIRNRTSNRDLLAEATARTGLIMQTLTIRKCYPWMVASRSE
jgi:hypothetical protein